MPGDVATTIVDAVTEASAARNGLAVAAALNCIEPAELADFFHVRLAEGGEEPIGSGLPASPGAASGRIALTADEAMRAGDAGEDVILVRSETTPDDVLGMQSSRGILTCRGGMVSHAAVVARGWGIPAVVGASDVHIGADGIRIGDTELSAGDVITIDGSSGDVFAGALATAATDPPAELATLLCWADTVAEGHVEVRANADTRGDAAHGRELGARGIGLCRTEHMFLAHDRLPIMRRFILADDDETRGRALAELEEAQTHDFERLLEAMDALPVTVRLLDPPLHEFLPDILDLTAREARGELGDDGRIEFAAVRRLHETNPMIGTRGVRLGAVRPGLYQMQVRALCGAVASLFDRGRRPHVEIMIPLVVDAEELRIARGWVTETLEEIDHPELASDIVTVGAMIETPRAALVAGALAEHADFFSFGTNDLTQMTYAFSRDDVEARLLPAYERLGILPSNPFAVLDQAGVGELVRIGCDSARHAKPAIKLGVCGEHAGDPQSADFLVRLGVDSVSCSPFRVPMARLGVAQALLACGRVHINDVRFDFDAPGDTPTATEGTDGPAAATTSGVDEIDEIRVLHTLRIRGFASPAAFEASLGVHPVEILAELSEAGLVRHVPTRDVYSLLPPGKERHRSLLDDGGALAAELESHYPGFLEINLELKELCSAWQIRNGEPNDHADADYDRACTERLVALNERTIPVIEAMATILPRLLRYVDRLTEAVTLVAGGRTERFTGVMCESFHDIWMELHEDLIVLQRIDRVEEGSF